MASGSRQRARRGAANRQDGAWARAEGRKHHGGGDRCGVGAAMRECCDQRQRHVMTGNDQGNDHAVDNEEKDSEPMPNQVRIKEEDGHLMKELAVLRARYLEPQLRTDCELPGGMLLRRPRHSQIAIKQWPQIHRQVELLEKQGEEVKLLWLLKKLRRHEIEGVLLGEPAPAIGEDVGDDNCEEVRLTIDLATSSDEEDSRRSFRPLDVETYVMNSWEVLYERTVKNEPVNKEPVKKEPAQEPRPANSRDEQRAAAAKDSDQAVADLAALADPAGAIAAAAVAQQRASAMPNHVRAVPGNDQGVDDELESSEEEDCEPVAKLRKNCVTKSEFVGVRWDKRRCKWIAQINHDRKQQHLGCFDDEHEAARAVDTAARRLRGEDAHGGRAGKGNWLRLNFPTEGEVKRAQERGALLTDEDKAAAAAASKQQGPSEFVGVTWVKRDRKWQATISHDGKQKHQGLFDDEHEAARAVDTAARRLRGEDAHDGRARAGGRKWLRLNFPTEAEVKQAHERGALLTAAAAAASERQGPSKFVGVRWIKTSRKWRAVINHDGKPQSLGSFNDEHEAARAVDTAARRLRGADAHGGRAGGRNWLRLNFPSEQEAGRAKALGMPAAP
eukprot:COSAG06_NODE_6310_length_2989_cov_55.070588_1_plen_615_part_00